MLKRFLPFRWISLALILSLSVFTYSCGDDEPPTEDKTPPVEQPGDDATDPSDTPEPEEEPESPPEDESKYFTPGESDLHGQWRVCWEKTEKYTCFYGKWTYQGIEISTKEDLQSQWRFPYCLAIIDNYIICGSSDAYMYLDDIVTTIEEKGTASFDTTYITNGNPAGALLWKWYPEANTDVDMLVIMSGKTVFDRWKITQFDGESFIASPAFYDMPKPEEGSIKYFYTYKFKRYDPKNHENFFD